MCLCFFLVFVVGEVDDDLVAMGIGLVLYAHQHFGEKIIEDIRDDHAYGFGLVALKAKGHPVWTVIVLFGQGLNLGYGVFIDFIAVF